MENRKTNILLKVMNTTITEYSDIKTFIQQKYLRSVIEKQYQ